MDLPCCKSFKLATLSLKRDLLATQHLIKSFANNDENIPYFTTIFVILFQTFYFLTFLWKHLAHSVYRVSAKKLPVWAVFFSTWLYGKYLVPSNQIFWGNFDYFMSKLTTFNQSAVLCLCWPLSALIFLSTNTQLLRAVEFAGALSFQLFAARPFSQVSKNSSKCNVSKSTFWVSWISIQNQVRSVDYTESSNFVSNHWYVSFAITVNGNN